MALQRGLKGIGRTVAELWISKHRLAALCFSLVAKTLMPKITKFVKPFTKYEEIHLERLYHIYVGDIWVVYSSIRVI